MVVTQYIIYYSLVFQNRDRRDNFLIIDLDDQHVQSIFIDS